jgi:hypothetical protein
MKIKTIYRYNSSLTQDTRSQDTNEKEFIKFFFNKTATRNFNAYKRWFGLQIQKTTLGTVLNDVDLIIKH